MALTDNAWFMHCLPVRRNMIVTDEVIESPRSIVIPEAANRRNMIVTDEVIESPRSIVIPEAANRIVSAQTVLKEILLDMDK